MHRAWKPSWINEYIFLNKLHSGDGRYTLTKTRQEWRL